MPTRVRDGPELFIWQMNSKPMLLGACALISAHLVMAQNTVYPADSTVRQVSLDAVTVGNRTPLLADTQKEGMETTAVPTDKILERTPGIQMIRRGNYGWEPSIRSLNAGQISITIDGMHMFGACTDRMDPVSSYVETGNISRIATNFGPGFDNYGGGIGGGVNFRLQEAATGAAKRISAVYGTGYETNARAAQTFGSLQYSLKRFAVAANGTFRRASNYRAANGQEIPFSQYGKWNVGLSAKYDLNGQNSISLSYIQDEGWNIGYPALTMDVAYANAKIASLTHHYHSNGKKLVHVKNKIYYNRINHAMDDTKRPPEQVVMHMDMPGRSWTAGFYSEGLYVPNTKHVIKGRVSGYLNRLSANMTMYPAGASPMYMYTIPDAQRIFLALDLADNIQLHKKVTLDINTTLSFIYSSLYSRSGKEQVSGIQQGNPVRTDFLFNVGTGLVWRPRKHVGISGNIMLANRAPSLQEYYAFYIYNRLDGYDYLGSGGLRPERSVNTELRVWFDHEWLRMEVAGFSYFLFDYIVGRVLPGYDVMTIGGNGVKQYTNIKKATLSGGEASLRIRFGKNIDFFSINTLTYGTDGDGFALPLVAPYQTVNGVQVDIKGYHARFELETATAQQHISKERYGETPTPGYTIVNLSARKSYRLKKHEIIAAVRIDNLFDTYYYRHLDIMKIPRPGRNIACSLTFKL